ncbi:hypothetical protein KIW84_060944 [Lathyrus oleraceus]|nr:hypothetical protein KIW84_060944 [Pisum sativum]
MIFFSILGKFEAVFASIPPSIIAALYRLFFATKNISQHHTQQLGNNAFSTEKLLNSNNLSSSSLMQSQQLSVNQTLNTQKPLTITRVPSTLTDGEAPSCSTSPSTNNCQISQPNSLKRNQQVPTTIGGILVAEPTSNLMQDLQRRVKLVTSIASLLGVGLWGCLFRGYKYYSREYDIGIHIFPCLFQVLIVYAWVFLVTGLNRKFGISDEWFAIGDSLILTVLSQASFMPVLVLAARLCPEGMDATLFATLMSVSNGGSVLGGLVGAGLTQVFGITKDKFDNLAALIIL